MPLDIGSRLWYIVHGICLFPMPPSMARRSPGGLLPFLHLHIIIPVKVPLVNKLKIVNSGAGRGPPLSVPAHLRRPLRACPQTFRLPMLCIMCYTGIGGGHMKTIIVGNYKPPIQGRAITILSEEVRELEKRGTYNGVAWDRWLAKVIFARDIHVIGGKDFERFVARFASHQQAHIEELR